MFAFLTMAILFGMFLLFIRTTERSNAILMNSDAPQSAPRRLVTCPSVRTHTGSPINCPSKIVSNFDEFRFYSESHEDVFAFDYFFSGKTHGTFVELGALDGEALSNTKFYEDYRGWTGVLIEPNVAIIPRLCQNRACSTRVHAAVCDTSTMVHYIAPPATFADHGKKLGKKMECHGSEGGILEFMAPSFRERWMKKGYRQNTTVPVECRPLHEILAVAGLSHIDFFSLDVEGGELAVLKTLDFSKVVIDVMVVELDGFNKEKDGQVVELLTKNGFRVHSEVFRNTWFVRIGSSYDSEQRPVLKLDQYKPPSRWKPHTFIRKHVPCH